VASYCSPTIYFSTFWEKQLVYSTHNPLLNPHKWIIVNEWSNFQRTSVLQYFQLHNFSMHAYTHNRLSALTLDHNHFLHHMVCNQVYLQNTHKYTYHYHSLPPASITIMFILDNSSISSIHPLANIHLGLGSLWSVYCISVLTCHQTGNIKTARSATNPDFSQSVRLVTIILKLQKSLTHKGNDDSKTRETPHTHYKVSCHAYKTRKNWHLCSYVGWL
jgi:hypothetical protein